MLPLLLSLALAGPVYEFPDEYVQGELVRPDVEVIYARADAPMSEAEAGKVVRRGKRRPPREPDAQMRLADALQVERGQALLALAARADQGEQVDFSALDTYDRRARQLYLEAAPGLPDDHAARALVLAAALGEALGLSPRPELESALELDPTGPYAEQVRLRLADLAFDRGELTAAAAGYEQVRALGGRHETYATYKLAWCRYNEGDLGRALGLIVPLAQESGPLGHQARTDAVRFASELARPEALAVVDAICAGDAACAEASALRLEGLWETSGR